MRQNRAAQGQIARADASVEQGVFRVAVSGFALNLQLEREIRKMAVAVTMRPLSERQYAKETFRASQAALSYPEKVRQLVVLQERLRPIYAARGRIIVPWSLDRDEAGGTMSKQV